MQLWLVNQFVSGVSDPKTFFRAAYQWRFGKDADVSTDILTYKIGGIIPAYVQEYVGHIHEKEQKNAVQRVQGAY